MRRLPEVAVVFALLALSLAVRLTQLGSVPRIITADEADNLQTAYSIIEGTGPGVFGFDWNPAPILGLYPLAWSTQVFGDSVADFRMYAVIFSLFAILLFYLLARESMGMPAAVAAGVLLSTNLWFLHFSRTAWENITAPVFALGAGWATTRALKDERRWWFWWVVTGFFVAGGFYSYFSGRLLPIAVSLMVALAIVLGQAPWRRTTVGLGIAGIVAAALFAPMVPRVIDRWDDFNERTNTVSVFEGGHYFDKAPWEAVRANLGRNYRGLLLQDGSEMVRGLWGRYGPRERAPLEIVGTHLFWAGLVVSAIRWRRTYLWWPFVVPLVGVELFSQGTPDLARALFFAPFYFLFIGMLFDEAFRLVAGLAGRAALVVAVTAVVTFVAISDVREYFNWQGKD